MKLTKKEAIKKHEELWQRIYEYYKDENNSIKHVSTVKELLIKDKDIKADCYLCEYTKSIRKNDCCYCPGVIHGVKQFACLNGLFNSLKAETSKYGDRSKILELCLKIKNVCKSNNLGKK